MKARIVEFVLLVELVGLVTGQRLNQSFAKQGEGAIQARSQRKIGCEG